MLKDNYVRIHIKDLVLGFSKHLHTTGWLISWLVGQ